MEMELASAQDVDATRRAWTSLVAEWSLTDLELHELLPAGGVGHSRLPRDTEARVRLLVEINNRVLLDTAELQDRLRLASPVTGWFTPLEVMSGAIGDLRRMRDLAEQGFFR